MIECSSEFEELFRICIFVLLFGILNRIYRAPDRLDHFKEGLVILTCICHFMDHLRFLCLHILRFNHILIIVKAKLHV